MPRIPATIAVVMLVATCIGFNTARFPVVLEMAAVQATSKQPRLIIPVEDSEPPADQSTDDQPGDESTDDQPGDESNDYRSGGKSSDYQPGDESNDYRSGGKSSDYRSGGESSDYRSGNESKRAGQPREVGDADWDDSSGFEGNRSSGELPGSKTAPRGKGRTQKESKSGKSARPVVASMGMAAGGPRPRPARATATRPVSNPIATPAAIPALRAKQPQASTATGTTARRPKTIRRPQTGNRPIRMDMVHTTRIKTAAKARRPQIHTAAPTAAPVQIPIRIPARILTGPPTGVPAGALTGTPIRNPMPVPMRILPEVRQAVLAGAPTGPPTGVPAGAPTGVPARATTRRPMGARMGVPLGVPPGIRMAAPAEIRVRPARNRLPERRQNAMAANLTPMPVR